MKSFFLENPKLYQNHKFSLKIYMKFCEHFFSKIAAFLFNIFEVLIYYFCPVGGLEDNKIFQMLLKENTLLFLIQFP